MKFAHRLAHLFIPRESNNQKAKLLHSSSITLISLVFILYQGLLSFIPKVSPSVLGYAANISPSEVIRLTNEKRAQAGLLPLSENSTLSAAAQAKGADMLNRDYWAHVAPDGTQPWKFFTDFGYKYRYAGENLARDFSNPSGAVEAWMASASHKDNLLSSKYKEIGVAVIEGDLAGVDTTIIVQFFGTKYVDTIPVAPVAAVQATSRPVVSMTPSPLPVAAVISTPGPTMAPAVASQFLISPFGVTKSVSLGLVGLLLGVLVVDGVLVSKRRIARIGGRSLAHLAFLGMITVMAILLRAGQVI